MLRGPLVKLTLLWGEHVVGTRVECGPQPVLVGPFDRIGDGFVVPASLVAYPAPVLVFDDDIARIRIPPGSRALLRDRAGVESPVDDNHAIAPGGVFEVVLGPDLRVRIEAVVEDAPPRHRPPSAWAAGALLVSMLLHGGFGVALARAAPEEVEDWGGTIDQRYDLQRLLHAADQRDEEALDDARKERGETIVWHELGPGEYMPSDIHRQWQWGWSIGWRDYVANIQPGAYLGESCLRSEPARPPPMDLPDDEACHGCICAALREEGLVGVGEPRAQLDDPLRIQPPQPPLRLQRPELSGRPPFQQGFGGADRGGPWEAAGPARIERRVQVSNEGRAGEVRALVNRMTGRVRGCYEAGLGDNANLTGHVNVRFVVGADGAFTRVRNGGADLPDGEVVACVVRTLRGRSVAPGTGIVLATATFDLHPGPQRRPGAKTPP